MIGPKRIIPENRLRATLLVVLAIVTITACDRSAGAIEPEATAVSASDKPIGEPKPSSAGKQIDDFALKFAEARPGCRAAADFAASVGAYVEEQGGNAKVDAIFAAFRSNPGYAESTYPGLADWSMTIIATETIREQLKESKARRYWLDACMKENGIQKHA